MKIIALPALAAGFLGLAVPANAQTYVCGDSICIDDQADETRELNLMQLQNPGAGRMAVPMAGGDFEGEMDGDADGEGLAGFAPEDDEDFQETGFEEDDEGGEGMFMESGDGLETMDDEDEEDATGIYR